MTQLERELKATLQIQEQMFKEELQKVTTVYEKHIKQIATAYTRQMNEALLVVERQNDTLAKQSKALAKYESISENWQISLDEKQVTRLEDLFKQQKSKLESLQQQLNSLERKL